MNKSTPTRTSYAHGRYDLPGDAFAAKLREARIARQFEAEANPDCAAQHRSMEFTEAQRRGENAKRNEPGRGSSMVQKQKPHPAPRPSWAQEPDRAAFNANWNEERRQSQIKELTATRDRLVKTRDNIDALEASIPSIDARAASGDVKGAMRDIEAGQNWITDERKNLEPDLNRARQIERGR